jgi:hypothetical protein
MKIEVSVELGDEEKDMSPEQLKKKQALMKRMLKRKDRNMLQDIELDDEDEDDLKAMK